MGVVAIVVVAVLCAWAVAGFVLAAGLCRAAGRPRTHRGEPDASPVAVLPHVA